MDEQEKLLPCPFCGGEAEEVYLEDEENFGGSVISCKSCHANSAVHFDRKTNLVSSWNERALPRPQAGAVGVVPREDVLTVLQRLYENSAFSGHDDATLSAAAKAIRALPAAPPAGEVDMSDLDVTGHTLKRGNDYPYDAPDGWNADDAPPPPAQDWAHAAARGVIADLGDRHTIKRGFEGVDEGVRKEIVTALAAIIRLAITQAIRESMT